MKRLALLILLCFLQGEAIAQWAVSLNGGATSTTITRSTAGRIDETYSTLWGYDFGIGGRYTLNPWLAIRADLNLMQRNHRMQRRLNYISPVYTDHLNTYLSLPLMADFSFGLKKLRGHLLLGGYCGFWLTHRVKGVTYGMTDYDVFFNTFNQSNPFTREDRRLNTGILCGIGLSHCLSRHIDLNLEALYHYDLVSHHIGYAFLHDYRYLNTLSLTLGIIYHFSNNQQQ